MEASALQRQAGMPGVHGRSPLLRLRSDEQLIAATRRGNQAAFETLVQRYQPRLLAFCRHMLNSKEDAEDVLQEVFAAAYNALLADERPINTRPWLYRIARNRSLNHLRKPRASGQDSMDIFEREHGVTTADTAHRREEFRQIVADVGELPETQRTALLLREIDALSYDQIAEAMDTTVPSVKSLLVRARVSLAEASEARLLTCAEVRLELGQVAEGIAKSSAPVRRHLKGCERCRVFRGELKSTGKALASVYPLGPMVLLAHKLGLAKLFGGGAAASAGAAGATAGGGAAAGGGAVAAGGAAAASGGVAAASGAISAGIGTVAGKAAAGVAAAALVTAGAVEVKHVATPQQPAPVVDQATVHPAPPAGPTSKAEPAPKPKAKPAAAGKPKAKPTGPVAAPPPPDETQTETETAAEPAPPPPTTTTPAVTPPPPPTESKVQEDEGTVTLPQPTAPAPPPPRTTPPPPRPAPPTTTAPPPPPPPPPTTTAPKAPLPKAVVPPPTTTAPPPPPPPPAAGSGTTTTGSGGATAPGTSTTPAPAPPPPAE